MFARFLVLALAVVAAGASAADGVRVEDRSTGQAASPSSASSREGDAAVVVFEQLQQFQSQIEALTGRVEQLEHALRQSSEQQRVQYLDLDGRINALKQAPVAAAPDAPVEAGTNPESPQAADAGQASYDKAQALVRERRFDEALKAFEQHLKQYPRGELAPQAMYWLGELWLAVATRDAPKAGRYFYRVYNEYPKHARAPAAMYRHALVQCETEEAVKGRATLNRLIVQYPGSPDAKLAETALRQQCR